MKILYNNETGRIYYTVYDTDWFKFSHTTNIPLTEFEIDEILPDNQAICLDLFKMWKKADINGDEKYYIENGELHQRDNWEEYLEDI